MLQRDEILKNDILRQNIKTNFLFEALFLKLVFIYKYYNKNIKCYTKHFKKILNKPTFYNIKSFLLIV